MQWIISLWQPSNTIVHSWSYLLSGSVTKFFLKCSSNDEAKKSYKKFFATRHLKIWGYGKVFRLKISIFNDDYHSSPNPILIQPKNSQEKQIYMRPSKWQIFNFCM